VVADPSTRYVRELVPRHRRDGLCSPAAEGGPLRPHLVTKALQACRGRCLPESDRRSGFTISECATRRCVTGRDERPVPTTTGRVGTATRPGSGKRGRKGDESDQWLKPLKRGTGSNLMDMGRVAARAEPTQGEATPIRDT